MAKEKNKKGEKVIEKTVNLTGKEVKKPSVVLKAKKKKEIASKEDIKKLNEELVKKKAAVKKAASKKIARKTKVGAGVKAKKAKTKGKYELSVDARDLLKAGCHLGHKKSKTHPKARESIYAIRNGVAVFDLPRSIGFLEKACNYIHGEIKAGKQIVMVGTKRQAREVVKRVAVELDVPYVTERWLGGTISNWDQIKKNIDKLNDLRKGIEENRFTSNTKKEQSLIKKEVVRLERIVGGLAKLDKLFDVMFVVDAGYEKTAVREAKGKGIPVVAMVDTDTDPRIVDWPIPLNDDNVKSVTVVVEEIGKAIK